MSLSNELQKDIVKLRVSSARKFAQLAGVDLEATTALAKEIDRESRTLQNRVREEIQELGESTAREHANWLRAGRTAMQRRFVHEIAVQRPSSLCLPLFIEDTAVSSSHSTCFGVCDENDPHIGPEPNTAHPGVDVGSAGVDSENIAETTVHFEFEFEPGGTGEYCLLPACQLNGYWLAWAWGSCDVGPEASSAHVMVEKSIQVFQRIDDIELPLALAGGGRQYSR